jgi:hypothetical protein
MASPAAPATALVVGVTSHRDLDPAQLTALRERVGAALADLRARFPQLSLVLLSPLAEGGDCLVAEVALELGARLVVPLPIPLQYYLEDFSTQQARERFMGLLECAEVIQMPLPAEAEATLRAPGPGRDRQYLRAGLHVATHCHLLLALWDGRDSGGRGGTADIVRYYLGGPVPGARRATDNLHQVLAGDDDSLALHLPVRRRGAVGVDNQDEPAWLTSAGRRPQSAGMPPEYARIFERMQVFERDRRWQAERSRWPGVRDPVEHTMRLVDAMAVRYQRLNEVAMQAIHLLAVAMGLAFLLYADLGAPDAMLWVFLSFFCIGLLVAYVARRRDWHRKYIDYRALAEGLRVQAFWRRAGLAMTGDPEFAHDNFMQKQDVELGWIRNVMRQAGLVPTPPDAGSREAVDAAVQEWIGGGSGQGGQLAYYERGSAQHERHHLWTRSLGRTCLWLGIAISLFLALFHQGLPDATRGALVSLMGALSLVAAVREAYAYRKADKELVKQYRFMHRIYRNAQSAQQAATSARERREVLRALGEAALAEHAEWALMHRDRPIEHGRP